VQRHLQRVQLLPLVVLGVLYVVAGIGRPNREG
jgi:hypothetical protein